ncbi:MAG: C2H2-type zinc finger protein [Candidatus Endonucleobacter bathymodioli]|uniref:C2H2-type zinc finger protein n=1 Tax=Candidatus Endonucleibacter bathymodioli TaxID=539814 RepID=A0AA90SSB9_9GAMM|nr:C2H2-type zinc finger protein [Candidatus Endonucleobacter bathymodioli]
MHRLNTTISLDSDNTGAIYLSARIEEREIIPWLESLKKVLTPIEFFQYTLNQQKRDNNTHHITVINTVEFPKINCDLSVVIGYQVQINIFGVGTIIDYDCCLCSMKYSNHSKLKRHMLIHMNEHPCICKVCGNTFKRKDNMNRHMKIYAK